MHTELQLVDLKGRDNLGDLGVDKGIMLIWMLKKQDTNAWSGWIWLTRGSSGGFV
jgi:hypothetical protein